MTWWISIVFYLWRNSFRRWVEQPLSILSKLVIGALLGMLSAVLIVGASYLGSELTRQMGSRDALTASFVEVVRSERASATVAEDDEEEKEWEKFGSDSLILYQSPVPATMGRQNMISIIAVRSPEAYGFPDTVVLLSGKLPAGTTAIVEIDGFRVEALVQQLSGTWKDFAHGNEILLGSVKRFSPLLQNGFSRVILLQAHSLDSLEKADRVVGVLQSMERRNITSQSALLLLRKIREIRDIQRYVLYAATIGSALVLGLVFGALAWMEFREERYLLALIRSFGVGRATLLVHAVVENSLLSTGGVLLGFGILKISATYLNLGAMNLTWLSSMDALNGRNGQLLVLGAALGGLLSCIPIGIGLRKPLGLVLK